MKKYDLFIFDLDGTITDSELGIISSVKYALNELKYPIPNNDVLRSMIGPPLLHAMKNILKLKSEDFDAMANLYRQHFAREGYTNYSVYTGMRSLFKAIKQSGGKIALATSKPITPTSKLLKYLGLTEYFDSINAPISDKSGETKSIVIAKALMLNHKNAVMIGDRKFDGEGAKDNNIDFIGAAYGFGSQEELLEAGALETAQSPMELITMFGLEVPKGRFISIEGMDGCGKTTQVEHLKTKLKQFGFNFIFTREPGGTKISEKIREILLSNENHEMHPITEALLYAASRAQHVQEFIKPRLEEGIDVLCDRYVDSSVAYQGGGRCLGANNIAKINSYAIDGLLPLKTIYLKMDASKAMNRRTAEREPDRLECEKDEFYYRTQEVFETILISNLDRYIPINADDSIENVANNIFHNLAKALEYNIDWEAANK